MKLTIRLLLFTCSFLFISLHPYTYSHAQSAISYSYVEELPDGYYATVYVDVTNANARSTTQTAHKEYYITSSSNEVVAKYTLTATFTYPYNNTAKCTSATYSTKIYNSNWSFSDCSATTSGNKASGHFVATHKVLGITASTIDKTITLTCDKNGNIS